MKLGNSSTCFLTRPNGGVNYEEARAYGFEAIDFQQITSAEGLNKRSEEELRERISKLPDDVVEQMTPENTRHLAQLIKYLNTQMKFALKLMQKTKV